MSDQKPFVWILQQTVNKKKQTFWSFDGPPSDAYIPLIKQSMYDELFDRMQELKLAMLEHSNETSKDVIEVLNENQKLRADLDLAITYITELDCGCRADITCGRCEIIAKLQEEK